jgi:Tfp pilus assembly protein PilX
MTRLRKLREGREDEGGFVIVYVIVLLLIALVIGTAALSEALSAHNLTTHDTRQRRAQQAADAGVAAALYSAREANFGTAYNFTGGLLGLGNFLDCAVPQLNVNLQVVGITAAASSAGVCPQALTSGGASTTSWSAQGDHAYYQSEFLSNKREQNGTGVGGVVEFPQIVSLGCDATSAAKCKSGASTNVYSRELALLQPTGPVQAIEGMGNVVISGVSALGISVAAVVNGDVMAGGTLTLPLLGVAVNTTWPTSGSPIFPTFGYTTMPAPTSISTANIVQLTGGFCTAGQVPSTSCMIKRPAPTAASTTCALCSTGITCSSCTGGGYTSTNDTFTLTGGTATFAAGDYVFCNFNATGGTLNTSPSSTTPVRIFILPPNQAPCSGYSYTAAQEISGKVGDFNASQGLNNSLLGMVNNLSNILDPSGVQIYVSGDGSYDNVTSVNIGNSSTCTGLGLLGICVAATAPDEGMLVYAPTSSVAVNTKSCVLALVCAAGAFSGSIVGDNVTVGATAITQDLDIGNYPVEGGANALRVSQYVLCDNSVTNLTNATSDAGGC